DRLRRAIGGRRPHPLRGAQPRRLPLPAGTTLRLSSHTAKGPGDGEPGPLISSVLVSRHLPGSALPELPERLGSLGHRREAVGDLLVQLDRLLTTAAILVDLRPREHQIGRASGRLMADNDT